MTAQITSRLWECADGAAHGIWLVEIANPQRLNAMTRSMWQQLRQVFEGLQRDPAVRCVVVQGAGGAFCAGGDISEYPDFRFQTENLAHFHEQEVWGALNAMLTCDVPLVASIQGACMGAGVEIASCCDVRLVADDAKFGAPIAKLGFPMAPKEMQLVAGAVGRHTAQRMLLEAAVFSAQEMAAAGWCVAPQSAADLKVQVQRTALRIASLAPQAARLNKQTMRTLASGGIPTAPYAYADSEEHREGIDAFLAKRSPSF
ncbi:enoyl-CoA hydratase/isomerase family protein [Comamonas sp.]